MPVSKYIRSATPNDSSGLAAIYASIVIASTISFEFEPPDEAEMAQRIARTHGVNPWLVYEVDGTIAGFAYAAPFRSRPAYAQSRETSVYVHPDFHRSGVARALMSALLGDLAERGVRVAIAGITLPNEASVALHEDLGFTYVGTFHEVGRKFGRWLDVGFWEMRLRESS